MAKDVGEAIFVTVVFSGTFRKRIRRENMNIASRTISYFIGCAYVLLALFSLFNDLPVKVVNAIAIGAVLLSISELVRSIGKLAYLKKQSFLDVLEREKTGFKVALVGTYMRELLKKKKIEQEETDNKYNDVCCMLQILAIMCIIMYPHFIVVEIKEPRQLGTFCTILSLGLILFSTFFSELYTMRTDRLFNDEFVDTICALFDSFADDVKETGKNKEQVERTKESLIEAIEHEKNSFIEEIKSRKKKDKKDNSAENEEKEDEE